jgi:Tfp pilus assembly protein PilP
MRAINVLVVVVLMSAPAVRGQTAAQGKPVKPVPAAQGQPPAKPAAVPAAPAKPSAAAPPATSPAAPAAQAKPVPPTPTPAPAAPAPAAPATVAPAPKPPPPETYVYRSEGRRDPFLSLIGTGSTPRDPSRRGEGPSSMTVGEISVRGIMQSKGDLVAMIQGPDKKTYIVHQGDKFLDGTIKTISPQGLVVMQEVNDPLSLVKQREVRKLLRSLEDAKE